MKYILYTIVLVLGVREAHGESPVLRDIQSIADNSSCRSVSNWGYRKIHNHRVEVKEQPPLSYIHGLAIMFTRSLCRAHDSQDLFYSTIASASAEGLDSITHYQSQFRSSSMDITTPGSDAVRAVYTLMVGHGMMESSGNYSTGYDPHGPRNESGSEAGLFQASYDAMTSRNPHLWELYESYLQDTSKCYLDIFSKNVKPLHSPIIGSGAGAAFQRFEKSCPGFATEFEALNLRLDYPHYGPIDRHEVYIRPECNHMFATVQRYYEQSPTVICNGLNER